MASCRAARNAALPSRYPTPGFTASSRLSNAVAATIAVGTLSLCAGVALAVLSIKASMALPIPT
jgi:hypothetical protein